MGGVRVLIADDDAVFRSALHDVLRADERFEVVGSAATGHEVVEQARNLRPELVLLDVRMPGGGPDCVRELHATRDNDGLPIVVAISAQTGAQAIIDMVRAGAAGYLGKGRLGGQLTDLLARILDGEVVLAAPGGIEALRQVLVPGPITSA